jgi:cysteine desulfurase family protein
VTTDRGLVRVHLDQASTSFPKPDAVWQATRDYLTGIGASPGRSSYGPAREAEALMNTARACLAQLLGVAKPAHIAFTLNATQALNFAIKGALRPGDHVVTTDLEHNSTLRPLDALRRQGLISYDVVRSGPDGVIAPDALRAAFRPTTRLLAMTHASNVVGTVARVAEAAALAHEHGALFLLDAAQTAGLLPVEADAWDVDLVAFTGHKGLGGPSGTGGLFVRDPAAVTPIIEGGTGTNSHSLHQPSAMPARYEAGTVNYLGVAGLHAAVAPLLEPGVLDRRRAHVAGLTARLRAGLEAVPGVRLYGPPGDVPRAPVVSVTMAGLYPSEACAALEEEFGILTRAGRHCAPLVHRALGTAPQGTLRFSLGASTVAAEVDRAVEAVALLSARHAAVLS